MKISIKDTIDSVANITFVITANELCEFAKAMGNEARQEVLQQIAERSNEEYLSPNETAKMIGVTKTTLYRWEKAKILSPAKIYGVSRYKKSDVVKILNNR